MKQNEACPCGSNLSYQNCCQRYHLGMVPENALVLMRSRYSAYALHLADYLMQTTHFSNPSFTEDKNKWRKKILHFSERTEFIKLEILDFISGNQEAFVTFIAYLQQNKRDASFGEKSRFEKIEDRWLYCDGKIFHLPSSH